MGQRWRALGGVEEGAGVGVVGVGKCNEKGRRIARPHVKRLLTLEGRLA